MCYTYIPAGDSHIPKNILYPFSPTYIFIQLQVHMLFTTGTNFFLYTLTIGGSLTNPYPSLFILNYHIYFYLFMLDYDYIYFSFDTLLKLDASLGNEN